MTTQRKRVIETLALVGIVLVCAVALACCGCMAHSDWYPREGSTLTDCERVMGRPADRVTDNIARWFLNGNLEAYAEFDQQLEVRGIVIVQGGKVRARHDFEIPRLTYFEWNGSAYNSMEPRQ